LASRNRVGFDQGTRRRLDLLLLIIGVPLATAYGRFNVDDPFITFRYAWNFATGSGLVFNAGEKILGTTSPLLALLLGTMTDSLPLIPIIGHVLCGAALIATALLLSRIIADETEEAEPNAAFIAPLFVLTSPLLAETQGFELNLYLAFVLAGIRAATLGNPGWAGLSLAVAALFRGDALVAAGLVGLYIMVSGSGDWRRFAASFLIPILAFAGAAWSYYGYPLPNTLAAKRAMGNSGYWRGYIHGGLRLAGLYVMKSPAYLALIPAAILGLRSVRRGGVKPGVALIFAWTVSVFAIYAIMGIPSAFNYYGMFVPVVGIMMGIGSLQIARRFDRRRVVAVMLIVICAAQLWPSRHILAAVPSERYTAYRLAADELRSIVGPEDTVAMIEIGILAYFSQVRVLDLVGLVHPEIGPHLAEGDVTWPVRSRSPEFVLLHDPAWPSIETGLLESDAFRKNYTNYQTLNGPGPYHLVLYKRN